QEEMRPDISPLMNRFDACRNFIRQKKIAFGLERCLYFLSPDGRCLSDKLKSYYVISPDEMALAFEDMCAKGKAPAFFIDRHCAAFLSVRDSKVIDSYLYELEGPEEHKR